MKKIYFTSLMFLLLSAFSFNAKAGFHVILLNDNPFSFDPANLTVDVGDTILFSLISGSHTTTSTSVPLGAASWNVPINNSNPSFQYVVTVEGQYNYQCNPHASMGMTGSFIAVNTSGLYSIKSNTNFNFYYAGNSAYILSFSQLKAADVKFTIYDVTGKAVRQLVNKNIPAGDYSEHFILENIQAGIYLTELIAGSNRFVRRVIIN